ncbi:chemotaxis protein CheA [bacterium]|nr:chemotaxis protein CheA [bacterium]
MDDFEKELKEGFLEESQDLLQNAEGAFLQLESNAEDVELINQIFRLAHNLKGTSRAVGFGEVAELTHHAENLILKLKNQELAPNDAIVSLLLEFNDRVTDMISSLRENFDASFDNSDLISKLESAIAGELKSEVVVAPENAPEPEDEALSEEAVLSQEFQEMSLDEAQRMLAEMDAVGGAPVDVDDGASAQMSVRDQEEESSPPPPSVKALEPTARQTVVKNPVKAKEDESIRVSLGRIEQLNNIVGELVILQTVLDQRRFEFVQDELSNKSIGQLGKLSKEIQEISMSLRMVPVRSTFQKMTRIVRDTSKALDKKVDLRIIGEETEIDKTVLEQIGDPLVHVVRNAIDHGLETPQERVAAGKPEEGLCEIKAFHEGSNLVIQVRDDGKGINPEIIRRKAIEKGVIRENSSMSDLEVIQLIFHAGFSTKEQVTEVSGRGVGMDVVKTNIENLSGEVNVSSQVGKGSVFKIVLPLTLAIIEGMVVKVTGATFIVPLSQVHEFVRIGPKQVETMSDGGRMFKLREEVLPLFSASSSLGLKVSVKDEASAQRNDKIAVVIRSTDFPYAVEVDDIVKQQQVVIKTLGAEIKSRKGFMGSSILGDGSPVVILDFLDMFAGMLKENAAYNELVNSRKAA